MQSFTIEIDGKILNNKSYVIEAIGGSMKLSKSARNKQRGYKSIKIRIGFYYLQLFTDKVGFDAVEMRLKGLKYTIKVNDYYISRIDLIYIEQTLKKLAEVRITIKVNSVYVKYNNKT